jgi:hypothetical protein
MPFQIGAEANIGGNAASNPFCSSDRAMETLPLASNTFRLLLFFTSGIPTYVHRASKLARSAAKKRRRTEVSASSIGSSGVHR